MSEEAHVKEQAALEYRHWVRITEACNNHCQFCLDSDSLTGRHLPFDDVAQTIRAGFQPGARLILSGGEASIHPRFVDFVRLGKEMGFSWIQTISNGRMWSSRAFCQAAVEAGLNEVTFSMHGHRPELHDELVGVPGGFKQALRGMMNLLAMKTVVVNVDVCINGRNYRELKDILAFYERLGVHEFDLLQVVPFGRAYEEHKETMLYDVDAAFPYLNEAFHFIRKPGNYVWTNRFPPAYLEGIEDLIQDPHKLHDEVRGRASSFEAWLSKGIALPCRQPERCRHCFLHDFCDFVERQRELWQNPTRADGVLLDLTRSPMSAETLAAVLDKLPVQGLTLRLFAEDYDQAEAVLARPWKTVHLGLDRITRLPGELPANVTRMLLTRESQLSLPGRFPGLEWEFVLNTSLGTALLAQWNKWDAWRKVVLSLPETETLSEAKETLADPSSLAVLNLGPNVTTRGLPPCLGAQPEPEEAWLDLGALSETGALCKVALTQRYIRAGYRVKSVRCRSCVHDGTCRGASIHLIRAFGFRQLRPVLPDKGETP